MIPKIRLQRTDYPYYGMFSGEVASLTFLAYANLTEGPLSKLYDTDTKLFWGIPITVVSGIVVGTLAGYLGKYLDRRR